MKISIDDIKKKTTDVIDKSKNTFADVKENVTDSASKFAKNASKKIDVSRQVVVKTIDQNGDNRLTVEDVIIAGLKIPGIRIKRDEFLKKEFIVHYKEDIVNGIIEKNPAALNIPMKKVDEIADSVIQYERLQVSGISAALSMPGGIAAVATLPVDIAQYYGYMLRATQKLLYLYGFPEIEINDEQLLDSATMNTIILCLGVMYGVAGANTALRKIAKALSVGVEKKLINTALTKGTIYPIVKAVAKWFNVRMNKKIFAGFFKKSIPVVGGVIGGGLTYATFKPCCERLKNTLKETCLSNPNIKDDELDIIKG